MTQGSSEDMFRTAGGQLRMSEALEKGMSRYTLYKLRDEGLLEQITQIPHAVDIALPRTARNPSLEYPKIQVHRFAEGSWSEGIEDHVLDAVSIRVYSPEKTLADCFRFRNQIGMDIILESLKFYSSRASNNYDIVLQYARLNRNEKAMYPYLEALSK